MGQIQKDKLFPPERGSPAPVFLSFEKVGALDAGVSQTSPPWPEISPVPWASAGAGFCRDGRCFPAEDAEQRKAGLCSGSP